MLRFIDKQIRVKFAGGRESSGTLKGFDPLLNIVLDDTIEYLREAVTVEKLENEWKFPFRILKIFYILTDWVISVFPIIFMMNGK